MWPYFLAPTSNRDSLALHFLSVALHGQTDAVRILLIRGSYQPDERDCCGTTPLMDAFRAGYVDIAKILIQQQHVRSLHHSLLDTDCMCSCSVWVSVVSFVRLNIYYICQILYTCTPFQWRFCIKIIASCHLNSQFPLILVKYEEFSPVP